MTPAESKEDRRSVLRINGEPGRVPPVFVIIHPYRVRLNSPSGWKAIFQAAHQALIDLIRPHPEGLELPYVAAFSSFKTGMPPTIFI